MSTIMWVAVCAAAAAFLWGVFGSLARRWRRRGTMYEVIRETAFVGFQRRRGLDPEHAAWATLALHPLDNDHRPVDRGFEACVRERSRRFARSSKHAASNDELRELTVATLTDYARWAADATDAYYKGLFEWAASEAQAELNAPQGISSVTFREYMQGYARSA